MPLAKYALSQSFTDFINFDFFFSKCTLLLYILLTRPDIISQKYQKGL